ncbi:hypothetical protein C8Q80DRAFT_67606 [Daedaleopsis nitida]|nr:hypothetical protein C8Q80DRAFT_67606 [Daedaleopsis nitida]
MSTSIHPGYSLTGSLQSGPNRLGPNLDQHEGTVSVCVSESILLRYLTVVKAAFAVSFTLPCLSLTLLQVKPKRSADDYPRLTRRSVLVLCSAPFAWALPVLITPIPHIVQEQGPSVVFNITSCYFDDATFTIVSLAFTLIPLGLAVIISTIMGVVVWRYSDTILENAGWLFVRTKRFARFASLVIVTMISATLYTVLLSLWLHAHIAEPQNSTHHDVEWREDHPLLTKFTRASVLWEVIS